MTDTEQREAARQFVNKWKGRGREDEDGRSYWIDFLSNVIGMDHVTDRVEFEKKVVVDGNTKRIDVYIPETHVLIEQKSLGIPLDHKILNSGSVELTPYDQAKRYNDNLPYDEKARWIVTCNFSDIWIYDMNDKVPKPNKVSLMELQGKYTIFDFLIKQDVKQLSHEMEVSIAAGEIVGKLYDTLLKQYVDPDSESTLKSLNILCVRLVFCLYSEDAGIFGYHGMFHDYLDEYSTRQMRTALMSLFDILDTRPEDRDPYLKDDDPTLAAFPYVNGGLFAEKAVEIPPFSDEIRNLLLERASADFDWSEISPTIFGAVFESTLNPETRRSGGMHYTSIENIHKVIDPLFLEDLKAEFNEIREIAVVKTRERKLRNFQKKLASLEFLDPACGSGNFLTETYISIRRLENEVLRELQQGQITFGDVTYSPIQVSIGQFYGIEINDFAVTVAKTALWIAESQMMKETESIVLMNLDFLPLKTNAYIVEENALRIDWESVVSKNRLSYIMGNPPFVGARLMTDEQKADTIEIFGSQWKNIGNLDYVSCWYKKAADLMKGNSIRAALVSTNSVTQGEAVANLWKPLFEDGVHFDFAHRTFIWDSEASLKAHVHCVIIGFSTAPNKGQKKIFTDERPVHAKNINGYLLDAPDVFIMSRSIPICNVPKIGMGNQPIDNGNYLFEKEEMIAFIQSEPTSKKYFKPWFGSYEFINRCPRYCLWLGDCLPNELRKMPECLKRVENVRQYRLSSKRKSTLKLADRPTHFQTENMPHGNYIVIPEVSSQRRRYVPMGYMDDSVLCSNKVRLLPNATLCMFGILNSNVHMAWMRSVCGRLKSDYDYSIKIVYNNFPWPTPTDDQKAKIEQTAQAILDARALYPDSSLADLYDPLTMPPELLKAHQQNDKAVMQAYGFDIKTTTESTCVAELMRMYQELTK